LWSLFGPGLSTFYFNLWDGCAIFAKNELPPFF
jgi:hypothetical protein